MEQSKAEQLLNAQRDVIAQIALSDDLHQQLNTICESIEALIASEHAYSSILLLKGNQLHHGGSVRLPKEYCEAIDGVEIGDGVGSCGTATFTKKQVIVSDINTDPLWKDYKDIALKSGLQSCWSTPIFSSNSEVLGSFAIYYDHPHSPSQDDLDLINAFTHLSGVAIEKHRMSAREEALVNALNASNEQLKTIVSVMPDLALVFDEDGFYVDIFGSGTDMLLAKPEELIGKPFDTQLSKDVSESIGNILKKTLQTEQIQVFEYSLDVLKGKRVFEGRLAVIKNYLPEAPNKRHVLWMARDITQRKENELKIKQLAYFDPLTELPNRRMLLERLDAALVLAQKEHIVGALLYCDLDNFKRINDSLGHAVGDQLLRQVADRLRPALTPNSMIARIGGDEFVVLLLGEPRHTIEDIEHEAITVSEQLIQNLKSTFELAEGEYKISASIGISLIDSASVSADDILKRADTTMYHSKSLGGNQFNFHNPVLQSIIDQRLALEREINRSIEQGHFTAYFQPQICPLKKKTKGAEALLRWNHPDKGMIAPDQFIPIAEQSGLIHKLQELVLAQTCQLVERLHTIDPSLDDMVFAINISASQFKKGLESSMMDVLQTTKIQPQRFKLEITESMLMDNVEHIVPQMQSLRSKGFKFSIDDFGTGYSSLSYLHTFPIDELKIDRSFVNNIDSEGSGIVDTIISLANTMDLNIIAEGVETSAQRQHLELKNVGAMQGYLFARPMPADELIEWLQRGLCLD